MACDLKEKGIAVGLIHPGMLQTNFEIFEAPKSKQKYFRPVEPGVRGGGAGDRRAHDGNHRVVHPRQLRQRSQTVPVVTNPLDAATLILVS